MSRWLLRLALVLVSIVGAGGVVLGAASAETAARELLVTCLTCGEQWIFAPSATLGAGLWSLIRRRRKPSDLCPKCGSRAVIFGHTHDDHSADQRRTS
jgi:hypothetical protein